MIIVDGVIRHTIWTGIVRFILPHARMWGRVVPTAKTKKHVFTNIRSMPCAWMIVNVGITTVPRNTYVPHNNSRKK